MKYLIFHTIILLVILFSYDLQAQNDQLEDEQPILISDSSVDTIVPGIEIASLYHLGKIHLRWAPNTPGIFFSTNKSGYLLERYTMENESGLDISTRKQWEVKPWRIEEYQPYRDSDEMYVLTAGECTYGAWESLEGEGLGLFAQAEELNNKFGLALFSADMDTLAADALAMRWVDTEIEENQQYVYFVRPLTDKNKIDQPIHLIASRDSLENVGVHSIKTIYQYVEPLSIDHVIEEENKITLHWDKVMYSEQFSAYWVERKKSDEEEFSRINNLPIVGAESVDFKSNWVSYSDSVQNYVQYSYRIVGITPFGLISLPSAGVKAMGRDRTPTSQPQNFKFEDIDGQISLSWLPVLDEDMDHYDVYRALSRDGSYLKINETPLPKMQTGFVDQSEWIYQAPYYYVTAVDTAGNGNSSLKIRGFLRDTIAPAPPSGLVGTIDSNGVVTIDWTPNTEEDLGGYMVYFSNEENYHFTNLTGHPLNTAQFVDTITLQTLTEDIYYRVTAVDQDHHISPFSEILKLKRPDIIPPTSPSFRGYESKGDHILLTWSPSRSHDVAQQTIWRRDLSSQNWVMISDNPSREFKDFDIQLGKKYVYKTIAIDDDGNECKNPETVVVEAIDRRPVVAPNLLEVGIDSTQRKINLTWESNEQHTEYILYRSKNKGPFVTLARLQNMSDYEDSYKVFKGNNYSYKLRAFNQKGRKSQFSNVQEITINPDQ